MHFGTVLQHKPLNYSLLCKQYHPASIERRSPRGRTEILLNDINQDISA